MDNIYSYCCKCERETLHSPIEDDEIFEFGLECLICNMVWEADKETALEFINNENPTKN